MENILLVLNIIFAIILVLLVLMQKSEGGALGIGVSQDNFMFSRKETEVLKKAKDMGLENSNVPPEKIVIK